MKNYDSEKARSSAKDVTISEKDAAISEKDAAIVKQDAHIDSLKTKISTERLARAADAKANSSRIGELESRLERESSTHAETRSMYNAKCGEHEQTLADLQGERSARVRTEAQRDALGARILREQENVSSIIRRGAWDEFIVVAD